jgi:hypothetical protein
MLDTLRRLGRLRAAALAVAFATLIPAAAADARPPIETVMQDDAAFLHRPDDRVREAMERAKALGVDRLRITAGWSVLAPDPDSPNRPDFDARDPDAYPRARWRNLDRAVRTAHDVGLEVMIDIAFWAPLWATREDPNEGRARWNIDPQAYTDFAIAVVRRYSGDFTPEPENPEEPPPPPSRDENLLEDLFSGNSGSGSSSVSPLPGLGDDEGDDEPGGEPGEDEGEPGEDEGEPGEDEGEPGEGEGQDEDGGDAGASDDPLPAVRWWTIWNEPNHPGFVQPQWENRGGRWTPRSPHIYRKLVEASYPAIKGVMPNSVVLVGGTSSTGAKRPTDRTMGVPPLRFLREMACVDARFRPLATEECRDYRPLQGDGWSHHPYSLLHKPNHGDPRNPDNLPIGDLQRLVDALDKLVRMRRIDPRIRDLYLTEYGYETNPPDPIKPFNPEQAARYINWAEYLAWKQPTVRSWPQFLLDDLGEAHFRRPWGDWQSGLFWVDGTPKPSATSFKYALFAECVPVRAVAARSRSARRRRARRSQARTVVIWGHVRPGSGPRDVKLVESRGGDAWTPAATAARARGSRIVGAASTPFATDAGGTFVRYAPYVRGKTYRLETAGGERGLPITPANCGRAR